MKESPVGDKLRQYFVKKNRAKRCADWQGVSGAGLKFGVREFIESIPNGTAQFVGTADGAVEIKSTDAEKCQVVARFKLTNTTSVKSALYHIPDESANITTPGMPQCNWTQTYEWEEKFKCHP